MSWFNSSFSFAKEAISKAQQSIDRVLDIQEGEGNGDRAAGGELLCRSVYEGTFHGVYSVVNSVRVYPPTCHCMHSACVATSSASRTASQAIVDFLKTGRAPPLVCKGVAAQ